MVQPPLPSQSPAPDDAATPSPSPYLRSNILPGCYTAAASVFRVHAHTPAQERIHTSPAHTSHEQADTGAAHPSHARLRTQCRRNTPGVYRRSGTAAASMGADGDGDMDADANDPAPRRIPSASGARRTARQVRRGRCYAPADTTARTLALRSAGAFPAARLRGAALRSGGSASGTCWGRVRRGRRSYSGSSVMACGVRGVCRADVVGQVFVVVGLRSQVWVCGARWNGSLRIWSRLTLWMGPWDVAPWVAEVEARVP
jgi:hypothetical protein